MRHRPSLRNIFQRVVLLQIKPEGRTFRVGERDAPESMTGRAENSWEKMRNISARRRSAPQGTRFFIAFQRDHDERGCCSSCRDGQRTRHHDSAAYAPFMRSAALSRRKETAPASACSRSTASSSMTGRLALAPLAAFLARESAMSTA